MRLREEVVTNIRSNQQLENDLNLMDIKIGLLVKNKITLQEVVSHSKKLTKKNKGQLSDMMMMNKQRGGLKALSKEKRDKLEAYQYLFYLLQVHSNTVHCSLITLPVNHKAEDAHSFSRLYSRHLSDSTELFFFRSDQPHVSCQADLPDATEQIHQVHGLCNLHPI